MIWTSVRTHITLLWSRALEKKIAVTLQWKRHLRVHTVSDGGELSLYPDSPPLLDPLIEEVCRHRCWHRAMFLDRAAKKAALRDASRPMLARNSDEAPDA